MRPEPPTQPNRRAYLASWPNTETDSAVLGNDATVPVSVEQLEWATHIFVMEKVQRTKLNTRFKKHLNGKKIVCLDIPDDFEYMQPELVQLLTARVGKFLG